MRHAANRGNRQRKGNNWLGIVRKVFSEPDKPTRTLKLSGNMIVIQSEPEAFK